MAISKSIIIQLCIRLTQFFSKPLARIHTYAVKAGIVNIPDCICNAPGGMNKNLQKIWNARLLKKAVSVLVRSPLRLKTIQLINLAFLLPVHSGSVIVTCHTPWKRLIVQWLSENKYGILIDSGESAKRAKYFRTKRNNYNEFLGIVRHLRNGGHIIIAADVFDQSTNCPACIMGKYGNLSLLPARLARLADVPMITVIPALRNGSIQLAEGVRLNMKISESDTIPVMQKFLAHFENEIKTDPSVWSYFVNDPLRKFKHKLII